MNGLERFIYGLKKATNYFLLLIIFILLIYSLFKGYVLNYVTYKIEQRIENKYPVDFSIKKSKYIGLRSFYLSGISIEPIRKDTLMYVDSIYVKYKLIPLLFGKIRLKELKIYNAHILFVKNDTSSNFKFLLQSRNSKINTSSINKKTKYDVLISHYLNKLFAIIPDYILIKSSSIGFKLKEKKYFYFANQLQLKSKLINASILFKENKKEQAIFVNGLLNSRKRSIECAVTTEKNKKITIALLKDKFGTIFGFDSLNLCFNINNHKNNILQLTGKASVKGLLMNHKKLAPKDVIIDSGKIDFRLHIANRYLEIDSNSVVAFNQLHFNPYIKFEGKPERKFILKIRKNEYDAQQFFESLPSGMFNTLEGIKVKGKLIYNFNFLLSDKQPDSMIIESNLIKKDFKLIRFGKVNYNYINESFEHEVYENGMLVKKILVGPENPNFIPFNQIPPYIKFAILTSEDADFFYNDGFNENAFRESFIENYKSGKFVRGGSTITMQLVKNVFLNRNKTISRKIEEIMIVWLMKNLHLSSKERLFEIYVNIIEWGPGIYGLKEASEFYFNKKPYELTLAECIYLTTVIPSPKKFKYSFDENGKPKKYISEYLYRAKDIMARRNQLSISDTINFNSTIELKGDAKNLLKIQTDSIQLDTTSYNTFFE